MIFPNVWELKKAAQWRQKGNIMAKYLGGIDNPDIDVFDISTDLCDVDFVIEFEDLKHPEATDFEKINIYEHITHYKVITSEKVQSSSYSFTWGLAGYLVGGPLWGAVGAILGGNGKKKTVSSHIVFCQLDNGWQFALEMQPNEFRSWKTFIRDAI